MLIFTGFFAVLR